MNPIKLTTICDWKPPASVKGIQSFLGFTNFYRKFIPNFFHIVTPLNLLTQKDQPWAWTPLQQKAFNTLRKAFSSGPVLGIPDVTCPFSIMTDASLFAAGAILLQDDTNGDSHPCTYFSKTFIPAELNYDICDHELLAVILTLKEWKKSVQGTSYPVTIITDHKNLSYIKDPCKLSQCQACWSLFLQDFDIVWKVLPGTKMAPADTLSCRDSIVTSSNNINASIVPLSTPWTSLLLVISILLLPLTLWCYMCFPTLWTGPPSSPVLPSKIRPSTTDTFISKAACMFPPPHVHPYSTPSMTPHSLVTSAVSAPKLSSNTTSGGRACLFLS